ncbi:MAG: hypothetical protein HYZ08_02760 [Candidatus Kerfeldbacteria bacterium]|nr:hypothetical protein [Candidatus Kerfeldbacteria bacterium]
MQQKTTGIACEFVARLGLGFSFLFTRSGFPASLPLQKL